jgi:hypothetical protein
MKTITGRSGIDIANHKVQPFPECKKTVIPNRAAIS